MALTGGFPGFTGPFVPIGLQAAAQDYGPLLSAYSQAAQGRGTRGTSSKAAKTEKPEVPDAPKGRTGAALQMIYDRDIALNRMDKVLRKWGPDGIKHAMQSNEYHRAQQELEEAMSPAKMLILENQTKELEEYQERTKDAGNQYDYETFQKSGGNIVMTYGDLYEHQDLALLPGTYRRSRGAATVQRQGKNYGNDWIEGLNYSPSTMGLEEAQTALGELFKGLPTTNRLVRDLHDLEMLAGAVPNAFSRRDFIADNVAQINEKMEAIFASGVDPDIQHGLFQGFINSNLFNKGLHVTDGKLNNQYYKDWGGYLAKQVKKAATSNIKTERTVQEWNHILNKDYMEKANAKDYVNNFFAGLGGANIPKQYIETDNKGGFTTVEVTNSKRWVGPMFTRAFKGWNKLAREEQPDISNVAEYGYVFGNVPINLDNLRGGTLMSYDYGISQFKPAGVHYKGMKPDINGVSTPTIETRDQSGVPYMLAIDDIGGYLNGSKEWDRKRHSKDPNEVPTMYDEFYGAPVQPGLGTTVYYPKNTFMRKFAEIPSAWTKQYQFPQTEIAKVSGKQAVAFMENQGWEKEEIKVATGSRMKRAMYTSPSTGKKYDIAIDAGGNIVMGPKAYSAGAPSIRELKIEYLTKQYNNSKWKAQSNLPPGVIPLDEVDMRPTIDDNGQINPMLINSGMVQEVKQWDTHLKREVVVGYKVIVEIGAGDLYQYADEKTAKLRDKTYREEWMLKQSGSRVNTMGGLNRSTPQGK